MASSELAYKGSTNLRVRQLQFYVCCLLLQTNTFQAVLITDGLQSYAVFTYKCGLMQWSGGAGIGFNTDSRLYKNHYLSTAVNTNMIACQNSPTSNWANVIYTLRK